MIKVRVSSKGQVVIPVDVRGRYGIVTGTELELREAAGYVSLHPLPKDPVAATRGFLRGPGQGPLLQSLWRERRPRGARGQASERAGRAGAEGDPNAGADAAAGAGAVSGEGPRSRPGAGRQPRLFDEPPR